MGPSKTTPIRINSDIIQQMAEWQSGHAADCNSVNIGSIPFSASNFL